MWQFCIVIFIYDGTDMLASIFLENTISVRHCFPMQFTYLCYILIYQLYSSIYCLYIIISYHPANGLMLSVRLLLQIMRVHTRLVVTAKSVSITTLGKHNLMNLYFIYVWFFIRTMTCHSVWDINYTIFAVAAGTKLE